MTASIIDGIKTDRGGLGGSSLFHVCEEDEDEGAEEGNDEEKRPVGGEEQRDLGLEDG